MRYRDKIVVITGHAQGIGRALKQAFEQEGALVEGLDCILNDSYTGDVKDPQVLKRFSDYVLAKHGRVDVLINNAMESHGGIFDASYDDLLDTLRVGAAAPFELARLFRAHFSRDGVIMNLSSTRDRMSQANTECYTAAKGAVSALTHALSVSLRGRVRVVSVSPGWIETGESVPEGADALQHPAGRVGVPADIVHAALFLCSGEASFITGENLTIDGGMTRQMIYHNDEGWNYKG